MMKKILAFLILLLIIFLLLIYYRHQFLPGKQYGVFFTVDNPEIAKDLALKLHQIDLIMPVWLFLKDNNGNIETANEKQLSSVMELLNHQPKKIPVFPVLSNHDGKKWQKEWVEALFTDPAKQDQLIAHLSAFLKSQKFAGINFDFEGFNEEMLPQYLAFLKHASQQLHAENLQIALCLSPHWKSIINQELADALDLIIPMIYDEHWSTSPPGPIASQKWFEETVLRMISKLPVGKLFIGVGNYAYDWPGNGPGRDISVETAIQIAQANQARIQMDPTSNNPFFRYVDDQLIKHQSWLLNAYTLINQLDFLRDYGVRGAILWQMGSEDPQIWEFYGSSSR